MPVLATLSRHLSLRAGLRWLIALACSIFFTPGILGADAKDIDLLKYQLQDLESEKIVALDQFRGRTAVLMFFEPECPFCFKQTKILNEIQQECTDFQAIGIGVNGNRYDLREEARHLATAFPTYQVSSELQTEVGKVEGTPMMLIANKSGQYSSHLRGYQKLDDLFPALVAAGFECS